MRNQKATARRAASSGKRKQESGKPPASATSPGAQELRGLKSGKAALRRLAERSPNELILKLPPGRSPVDAGGETVVAGLAANACATREWTAAPLLDQADVTACMAAIVAMVGRVNRGELADAEALLTGQAVTLNTMFIDLARRARTAGYLDSFERYLRLAFKAQGQCRATCETLAVLKNPPVFARNANIAHNQQVNVNGGQAPTRAVAGEPGKSKLLEAHGERLDSDTQSETGTRDLGLAAVGALDGTTNG